MKSTPTPLTHKPMLHAALLSDWYNKYIKLMLNGDGRINISKPAAMSHDYYLIMIRCIDSGFALKMQKRCSEKRGKISHVVVELSKSRVTIKATLKLYELNDVVKEFYLFEKKLNKKNVRM